MIASLLFGLTLVAPVASSPGAFAKGTARAMNEIMPGMILVKYSPSRASTFAAEAATGNKFPTYVPGGEFVSRIAKSGWTLWRVPNTTDVRALATQLMQRREVAYAEPVNRIYPLITTPNDGDWSAYESSEDYILYFGEGDPPTFRRLWHLDDINAEAGWTNWPNTWYTAASKPANAPLIAVIDTGCDMGHPDFVNAGGFGPDVSQGGQWDMAHSKQFRLGELYPAGSPEDAHGHGTHVAGLALAAGNNGSFDGHGVIGVGYNSKGAMLRVFDQNGVGTDADAAAAIFYAADINADVINASIGTTNYSQVFQDAVTYAFQKGTLVVAAANESGDGGGDIGPIYPAACSGALAVTGNGPDYAPGSSYAGAGPYVDVAAPGGDLFSDGIETFILQYVYSTAMRGPFQAVSVPPYTNNYAYLLGTSMACPQVAGAAGLYYGKFNLRQQDGWSNVRAYRAIEKSALGVMGAPYGGWEYFQGYGCLDVGALMGEEDARLAEVGAIEGIIYNNATPVSNVQIKARRVGSTTDFSTTSQEDGTYRFEALPPGVYRLTTAPFGALKVKNANVLAGSDITGVDFWCGTFTWDETAPVVARFQVSNVTATGLDVRHWAYDPETSIDVMQLRIGTTQGANDVMADVEVFSDKPLVHLNASLSSGTTYWLRGHYVDGAGFTTNVDFQFQLGGGATNVTPSSYSIQRGVLVSGGTAEMATSNDVRFQVKNGPVLSASESPITVLLDATSPVQTASDLKFNFEGSGSFATLLQTIDLFDFQAGAYVTVSTRQASTSDSTVLVTATNPNRFIQSGTRLMRARIRLKPNGPVLGSAWVSRMDLVQWQVTP